MPFSAGTGLVACRPNVVHQRQNGAQRNLCPPREFVRHVCNLICVADAKTILAESIQIGNLEGWHRLEHRLGEQVALIEIHA